MSDAIVKFCCDYCNHLNRIQKDQIDEAVRIGNKPMGVCGHCGLVSKLIDPGLATQVDSKPLHCVPSIDNWPERLPTGSLPGGKFAGAHGNAFTEAEFMVRYRVNPRINLVYRRRVCQNPKRSAHDCIITMVVMKSEKIMYGFVIN